MLGGPVVRPVAQSRCSGIEILTLGALCKLNIVQLRRGPQLRRRSLWSDSQVYYGLYMRTYLGVYRTLSI